MTKKLTFIIPALRNGAAGCAWSKFSSTGEVNRWINWHQSSTIRSRDDRRLQSECQHRVRGEGVRVRQQVREKAKETLVKMKKHFAGFFLFFFYFFCCFSRCRCRRTSERKTLEEKERTEEKNKIDAMRNICVSVKVKLVDLSSLAIASKN